MKTFALAALLTSLLLTAPDARAEENFAAIGKIDRIEQKFDEIVPKDAKIEKLAEGFEWSEGPVWVKDGGYLLFSDVPHNVVHRWSPDKGLSDFLKPSGYTGEAAPREPESGLGEPGSNGLTLDKDGNLVLCQHGDRRVARLGKHGDFETLADKYEGKRLNSPNDLTFDKSGNLFFTDPPYGLPKTFKDEARELDYTGVYRLSADGKLTLLTKEMSAPNGIALSPDEKTLYVANSDPEKAIWMAFDLGEDGAAIKAGRMLFDTTAQFKAGRKGLPDGLKVAQDGTIFATGPGGVYVFTPEGKHLGTIDPGEATANCAFGGEDGSTLYMTSDMYLTRIRLTGVKGKGF